MAEWPCCHDPVRFNPCRFDSSLPFIPLYLLKQKVYLNVFVIITKKYKFSVIEADTNLSQEKDYNVAIYGSLVSMVPRFRVQ